MNSLRRQNISLAIALVLLAIPLFAGKLGLPQEMQGTGYSLGFGWGLAKVQAGAAAGYIVGRLGLHYEPTKVPAPWRYAFGIALNAWLMGCGMVAAATVV